MELRLAILVHVFLFNIPLRFFCLKNVQTNSAVHPASCLVDTRVLFLGVEWQVREVDRSPPSGAWLRIVELDLCLHGIARENFTVFVLALKTYLCMGFMLLQI